MACVVDRTEQRVSQNAQLKGAFGHDRLAVLGRRPAYETSARIAANKCAIINPLGRYALGFRTSVSAQFCTWMSPDRLQPALEWSSCERGLCRPRPIARAGARWPRARRARAGPRPRHRGAPPAPCRWRRSARAVSAPTREERARL